MGWLARLFGAASREELRGLHLDESVAPWAVDGPRDFSTLLRALEPWLAPESVLYFEGGYLDAELASFLAGASIPEQVHLALGTIWPRPRAFHVPAGPAIVKLADLMEHHPNLELAVHFHVYRKGVVLLQWHDAFDGPMLLAGSMPEAEVKTLAETLRTSYRRGR
jgi:hypothetical protein